MSLQFWNLASNQFEIKEFPCFFCWYPVKTGMSYEEYEDKDNKDSVQIQGFIHLLAQMLVCIFWMANESVSHKV